MFGASECGTLGLSECQFGCAHRACLPPPTLFVLRYLWCVYHAEDPYFGHLGSDAITNQAVGVFLTPLSGITDKTSTASYGGGPLHQDLAVRRARLPASVDG